MSCHQVAHQLSRPLPQEAGATDETRLLFAGFSIREDASPRATSSSSHFKRRRHQSLLEKKTL